MSNSNWGTWFSLSKQPHFSLDSQDSIQRSAENLVAGISQEAQNQFNNQFTKSLVQHHDNTKLENQKLTEEAVCSAVKEAVGEVLPPNQIANVLRQAMEAIVPPQITITNKDPKVSINNVLEPIIIPAPQVEVKLDLEPLVKAINDLIVLASKPKEVEFEFIRAKDGKIVGVKSI